MRAHTPNTVVLALNSHLVTLLSEPARSTAPAEPRAHCCTAPGARWAHRSQIQWDLHLKRGRGGALAPRRPLTSDEAPSLARGRGGTARGRTTADGGMDPEGGQQVLAS